MSLRDKVYKLREETIGSVSRYFISFTDGQGVFYDLEVSENLYIEFRQLERRNRNLQQFDERHREYDEIWDEALNRRSRVLPKSVEDAIVEKERMETLHRAVAALPDKQRRRFILYYGHELTYTKIGKMEGCTGTAIKRCVDAARKKVIKKLEE